MECAEARELTHRINFAQVSSCDDSSHRESCIRHPGWRILEAMPQVLIPTPLRKLTNELAEVAAAGATVGDVLANLESAFPGVRERLFDEAGEIRRFILVHVNGEDIRFLDGLKTPVGDRDELSITPALAGG
jgi:sulfur-carrier protein